MSANRWIMCVVVVLVSLLLFAARSEGGWIERDSSGHVRLHGRFEPNGDYVLELFAADGVPGFRLVSQPNGDAGMSLLRGKVGLTLRQCNGKSQLLLQDAKGAEAVLDVDGGLASLTMGNASGSLVRVQSEPGVSLLLLRATKDDRKAELGMSAKGAATYMYSEIDGKRGIEVADSRDRSVVSLGGADDTGRANLVSWGDGRSSISLSGPQGKGGVLLQQSTESGAGVLVLHENGMPAFRMEVDSHGRNVAVVGDSEGAIRSLVEADAMRRENGDK